MTRMTGSMDAYFKPDQSQRVRLREYFAFAAYMLRRSAFQIRPDVPNTIRDHLRHLYTSKSIAYSLTTQNIPKIYV